MIELCSVGFSADDKVLLNRVNLKLSEHRIAVIGANGSGKSTFARLLNGLLLPTVGDVLVDNLNTRTNGKSIRQKVGFVFQNPDNQIVFPTVAEDLAFGLKNLKLSDDEIELRVTAMLSELALVDFRERLIHQLSGGEKQLVAIGGVLVMAPQIIVFDEPTTLLDLGNKKRINNVIKNLPQQVLLVTHDLDLLDEFDRVICFENGEVVKDGLPVEVIDFYRSSLQ